MELLSEFILLLFNNYFTILTGDEIFKPSFNSRLLRTFRDAVQHESKKSEEFLVLTSLSNACKKWMLFLRLQNRSTLASFEN